MSSMVAREKTPVVAATKPLERRDGERSETARSEAGFVAGVAPPPDPEVEAQAKRRRFTNDYKLRILREADSCRGPGEIGALLRREGLYSSHLAGWRTQRAAGGLRSGVSNRRGPKPQKDPAQERQLRELERENRRLKRKLEHAESIIAIQKKVAVFLEALPNSPPDDGNDS